MTSLDFSTYNDEVPQDELTHSLKENKKIKKAEKKNNKSVRSNVVLKFTLGWWWRVDRGCGWLFMDRSTTLMAAVSAPSPSKFLLHICGHLLIISVFFPTVPAQNAIIQSFSPSLHHSLSQSTRQLHNSWHLLNTGSNWKMNEFIWA